MAGLSLSADQLAFNIMRAIMEDASERALLDGIEPSIIREIEDSWHGLIQDQIKEAGA
jgi:hypothetical protein